MVKSLSNILHAGVGADKFREHLGQTLEIRDWITVQTKNGESVQMIVANLDGEEVSVWAPSIVARQVQDLAEGGYLPGSFTFAEETGLSGRQYFTLVDPEEATDRSTTGAVDASQDSEARLDR